MPADHDPYLMAPWFRRAAKRLVKDQMAMGMDREHAEAFVRKYQRAQPQRGDDAASQ